MLYWYRGLMLGENLKKKPGKHIRRVEQYYRAKPKSRIFSDKKRFWEHLIGKKVPWKGYFVVTRAVNPDNLFDVMGTRQWVFRHYARTDIYVIGLYRTKWDALDAVRMLLEEGYREDAGFDPRKRFADDKDYKTYKQKVG